MTQNGGAESGDDQRKRRRRGGGSRGSRYVDQVAARRGSGWYIDNQNRLRGRLLQEDVVDARGYPSQGVGHNTGEAVDWRGNQVEGAPLIRRQSERRGTGCNGESGICGLNGDQLPDRFRRRINAIAGLDSYNPALARLEERNHFPRDATVAVWNSGVTHRQAGTSGGCQRQRRAYFLNGYGAESNGL